MRALEKLIAEEGIDPREEESRLGTLFAQIEQVVRTLPGISFEHLEPGEMGLFRGVEWNAWLYMRETDRVFPFRLAVEPGRNSRFRMRVHPDMERPTETTLKTWLAEIMREQINAGVDEMVIRLRYWNDNREEPVRRGERIQRGS
jgi:hypothetical protein